MGKFKILPRSFTKTRLKSTYTTRNSFAFARRFLSQAKSVLQRKKIKNERVDDVVVVVECIDNFYKLCVLNGISWSFTFLPPRAQLALANVFLSLIYFCVFPTSRGSSFDVWICMYNNIVVWFEFPRLEHLSCHLSCILFSNSLFITRFTLNEDRRLPWKWTSGWRC